MGLLPDTAAAHGPACGLRDEAIEQARTHPEGGTWYAAWSLSHLLAEAGRREEAVAVIEQHPDSTSTLLAHHLVDLGRVEEAVRIVQARPSAAPAPDPSGTTYSAEPPF